jgi:hypothetical protein
MPHKLSSNEQEAANRAEATALLIRAGYRVYRPEADVHGEDLVLRAPSSDDLRQGDLRPVQLKGRPTVARKYEGKGIWMLFPDPRGTCRAPLASSLRGWRGITPQRSLGETITTSRTSCPIWPSF